MNVIANSRGVLQPKKFVSTMWLHNADALAAIRKKWMKAAEASMEALGRHIAAFRKAHPDHIMTKDREVEGMLEGPCRQWSVCYPASVGATTQSMEYPKHVVDTAQDAYIVAHHMGDAPNVIDRTAVVVVKERERAQQMRKNPMDIYKALREAEKRITRVGERMYA